MLITCCEKAGRQNIGSHERNANRKKPGMNGQRERGMKEKRDGEK